MGIVRSNAAVQAMTFKLPEGWQIKNCHDAETLARLLIADEIVATQVYRNGDYRWVVNLPEGPERVFVVDILSQHEQVRRRAEEERLQREEEAWNRRREERTQKLLGQIRADMADRS